MHRTTFLLGALLSSVVAQTTAQAPPSAASELRDTVDRYAADRAALLRRYDVPLSPARQERMRARYEEWKSRLRAMDFDRLGLEGRVDYVLLDHEVTYQLALLDREARQLAEMRPWLPFAGAIMDLAEARRRMEVPDGRRAAETLTALARAVDSVRQVMPARTAGRADLRDLILGRRAALAR